MYVQTNNKVGKCSSSTQVVDYVDSTFFQEYEFMDKNCYGLYHSIHFSTNTNEKRDDFIFYSINNDLSCNITTSLVLLLEKFLTLLCIQ